MNLNRELYENAWLREAAVHSPYEYEPSLYNPVRNPMTQNISEFDYRGLRIVATKYNGAYDKSDTMGFDVPVAFVVLDAFDDPALPIVQHQFWSPWDAKNAIDFVEWVKPTIDAKKWPTSVGYEFNLMIAYKRNFTQVYATLKDIENICRDSFAFDENPAQAVLDRLKLLGTAVAEGR